MKELNIPIDCDNCRYAAEAHNNEPCCSCYHTKSFKPNPMFNEVYERGARDMYDAVKKLDTYSRDELADMFHPYHSSYSIVECFSPMEIMEKIQEYEEEKAKELHVGDVVLYEDYPNPDIKGVVTYISDINDEITIMWANGRIGKLNKNEVNKVQGEHIDLGDILKKLGGK